MTKKVVLKVIFSLIIMISPAIILFYRGGSAYAIPYAFLVILFMYLNNLNCSLRNNYTKIITAIPLVALLYFLASPKTEKTLESNMPNLPDMKIVVILSCISVFIAITSALLILKRTKGEKAHD